MRVFTLGRYSTRRTLDIARIPRYSRATLYHGYAMRRFWRATLWSAECPPGLFFGLQGGKRGAPKIASDARRTVRRKLAEHARRARFTVPRAISGARNVELRINLSTPTSVLTLNTVPTKKYAARGRRKQLSCHTKQKKPLFFAPPYTGLRNS